MILGWVRDIISSILFMSYLKPLRMPEKYHDHPEQVR